MKVVVITDRRLGDPVRALARLPLAGVEVQVREKDLDGGALLTLVRDVMSLGAPTWVNDRADVAAIAGAHGVHLPESGLAMADVQGLRVGVSRHAPDDPAGASSVQLGPIFATPGKGAPLGVGVLGSRPRARLVAVGGIDTPEKAAACLAAGADAVAVIRAGHDPVLFSELLAACANASGCVKDPTYPPL